MTRRTLLWVLMGLVLPLPLVLIAGVLWRPSLIPGGTEPTTSGELEISPVLPLEERRRLLTFERPCSKREDCEPPLGCLSFNGRKGFCVASECLTDLQCSEGLTCRILPTLGRGPRVRSCVAAGRLPEGAPCDALTMNDATSCGRGLVCNGFCGRPCRLEEPSTCPEGFFCRSGPGGPACAPSCEGRDCPSGQQCVRFSSGVSMCAVAEGHDCQTTPCPSGQQCRASFSPGRMAWAELECVIPCEGKDGNCPDGFLCHQKTCRRPCSPSTPDACGPGHACSTFDPEEERWLCGVARSRGEGAATGTSPP